MPDSAGNYQNFSDLPSIANEGDTAIVAASGAVPARYEYANLSAITSFSFKFGGDNSFLQTTGKTSSFTDSSNPFTAEFWSYIEDSVRAYPM